MRRYAVDGGVVGHAESEAGVRSRLLRALTTPLPRHLADYRESARTLLLFVALSVTLATLSMPHVDPLRHGPVLILAAAVLVTAVCSAMPAFHALLNQLGGLLVLVQIATLVALTGGESSLYTPLYVILLLYAAVFYGPLRLLATGVVVFAVLLLPYAYGEPSPAFATQAVVQVSVWLVATSAVHWLVARIRASAQTDGLTGLWNHATFWQLLRAEHQRAARYGTAYSLILLDIDHFKLVNDTRGHPVGDEVLRGVAEVLLTRCRASDLVGRYGGEEFVVLLPETSREEAVTLARELRVRIAGAELPVPVTISLGVACSADTFVGRAEDVVAAADEALYEAKRAGRNHVAVALPSPAPAIGGAAL